MGLLKEFKDFAMRGNVIDMAVGIVIGGAFGKIVSSFVADIVMPPLGMITGGVDFKDLAFTLQEKQGEVAAVTINYGNFLSVLLDFIIIAFAIFMVIKAMNTAQKRFEKEQAEKPAEPPKPSAEVVLLTEIRDGLANRS